MSHKCNFIYNKIIGIVDRVKAVTVIQVHTDVTNLFVTVFENIFIIKQ